MQHKGISESINGQMSLKSFLEKSEIFAVIPNPVTLFQLTNTGLSVSVGLGHFVVSLTPGPLVQD